MSLNTATSRDTKTIKAQSKTVAATKAAAKDSQPHQPQSVWQIVMLPVDRIEASPYQPRLSFDPLEMADLVASVRVHGVQQPIIARTCQADQEALQSINANGQKGHRNGSQTNGSRPNVVRYQLIAGERRLRACKEAGRRFIPTILRDDLSDVQAAELALLENIQRSNLTVIEEAAGYKRLMLDFRLKEERIAKKVGKSVQTIKDTIKLLALPEPVQRLLAEKKLTAAHGRELLALAPFERVCVLVAQAAARDHLTATSLAATPLPNAHQLKSQGLLMELDHRTRFDWKEECARCPHKAYVRSGYSSYCLLPIEWKQKQDAAVELKKQEATRVMEDARQEGHTSVETDKLPTGSYRDLTYVTLPSGCSAQCACRGEADDPRDPTCKVSICLDPNRFNGLVQAERQAHEETRRRHFTTLWSGAKDVLCEEQAKSSWRKVASLLALPVLQRHHLHYFDPEAWQHLVRQTGRELDVSLDWEALFDTDDHAEVFELLQEVEPDRLLLFTSCLLLAQEASEAIRFSGTTPNLNFVLGLIEPGQPELTETQSEEAGEENNPLNDDDFPEDNFPEDHNLEDDHQDVQVNEPETSLSVAD